MHKKPEQNPPLPRLHPRRPCQLSYPRVVFVYLLFYYYHYFFSGHKSDTFFHGDTLRCVKREKNVISGFMRGIACRLSFSAREKRLKMLEGKATSLARRRDTGSRQYEAITKYYDTLGIMQMRLKRDTR